MAINKIKTGSIQDNTITADDIQDGAITNAKVNACAAIAQSKISGLTTSISNLCSSISSVSSNISQQANNIGLLGFKMAVNDGLTIFNLVDGVVDEFNDESGTDEAEGSNDLYNADSDFYVNSDSPTGAPYSGSPVCYSAGFGSNSITEPDTSTDNGNGNSKDYTVPQGMTSVSFVAWGGGGGAGGDGGNGGGGGSVSGNLAVTPGQSLKVFIGEGGTYQFGGGEGGGPHPNRGNGFGGGRGNISSNNFAGTGGGATFVSFGCTPNNNFDPVPQMAFVAGAGGGGSASPANNEGGGGGGTVGANSVNADGGQQTQGGPGSQNGGYGFGGDGGPGTPSGGGGGSGFYGGGGGPPNGGAGGGGSGYVGNPAVSCGAQAQGASPVVANAGNPLYPSAVNDSSENGNVGDGGTAGVAGGGGAPANNQGDGYVFLYGTGIPSVTAITQSTTIISTAFSSTSVPTSARIVVFEENVDTPTLNTDIIASVSRDSGVTYSNATLSDSGYVTGSSGQRILTGQADISGQPSGQSMRWKLALANNTVKIHGVALQWS